MHGSASTKGTPMPGGHVLVAPARRPRCARELSWWAHAGLRGAPAGAAWLGLPGALLLAATGCGEPVEMSPERACDDVAYAISNAYARCTNDTERAAMAYEKFTAVWACDLHSDDPRFASMGGFSSLDRIYTHCVAPVLATDCAVVAVRAPADRAWIAECEPQPFVQRGCTDLIDAVGDRVEACSVSADAEADGQSARQAFRQRWQCTVHAPIEPTAGGAADSDCVAEAEATSCEVVRQRSAEDAAWFARCPTRFVQQTSGLAEGGR